MAKFCGNCGAKLDDDDKVCGQCGAPVDIGANSSPVKVIDIERKRKNKKMSKNCYRLDKKNGAKHTGLWYAFFTFRGKASEGEGKGDAGDSPGF